MAAAVEQLHSCGFVHRDLRLNNWLRTADGAVILSDLGAAVPVGTAASRLTPFGFNFGPLCVLEAMAAEPSALIAPAAEFQHDWEQLARVIIAAVAGVRIAYEPSDYDALLRGWRAVDASLPPPYRALLQLATSTSPKATAASFQEAVSKLCLLG